MNTTAEFKKILNMYEVENKSIGEIAKELNTYPNKIRRILIKLGAKMKTKSEAQKLALQSGRHKHPTKGKERDESTKLKISNSVADYWENMDENDYQERVEKGQKQWENMSETEKHELQKAAGDAVRKAAKEGSKMEKYIYEELVSNGYTVQFHRKGLIINEDLEVDIFVVDLETIIEIDGPAHFLPIWGQESLNKHIKADAHKNGLLLSNGYIVLRIKNMAKSISEKKRRDAAQEILKTLKKIENKKPSKNNRYIELEIN